MLDLYSKVKEAVGYIRTRTNIKPEFGVILGTGLGDLANSIESRIIIPYKEIPHFPRSTVKSHLGNLVIGRLGEREAAVMQGRLHYYEGYSMTEVAFPVWVLRQLGASVLIIVSAAGGLSPSFKVGDIMLITDHINLMGDNPLRGVTDERLGERFPSMAQPYDRELIRCIEKIAEEEGIEIKKGTYAGVQGPSLETQAETKFIRSMEADAVGMSTVPEVIVGVHCGFRILGMAAISNVHFPGEMQEITVDEIIAGAASAKNKLEKLIIRFVKEVEFC